MKTLLTFLKDSKNEISDIRLEDRLIEGLDGDIFSDCPNVERIHLSQNFLTQLPENLFSNCPALQEVYLDENYLEYLPPTLFSNCEDLRWVALEGNKLKRIPERLFKCCTNLEFVDFRCNQLYTLPSDLFSNCKPGKHPLITDSSLAGNPMETMSFRDLGAGYSLVGTSFEHTIVTQSTKDGVVVFMRRLPGEKLPLLEAYNKILLLERDCLPYEKKRYTLAKTLLQKYYPQELAEVSLEESLEAK